MSAPAPAAGRSGSRLDAVWAFFVSLRLTLWLCAALAVTSALGTVLNPRPLSVVELRTSLGDGALFTLARALELQDVFHSWWYTLLLWALALNLLACTLERLPRVWVVARRPERLLTDAALAERSLVARGPLAVDPATLLPQLLAAIERAGFSGQVQREPDGRVHVFAERGRLARLGAHVTHLALLVILGGGVLGRLAGSEGRVQVAANGSGFDAVSVRAPDGSSFPRELGIGVQVLDLRLVGDGDGPPRAESEVLIVDGEQVVSRQTLTVNHPVVWKGWSFYQAGWEEVMGAALARLEFKDRLGATPAQTFDLEPDQAVTMADGVEFGMLDFQPDWAGQGPAVHLARSADGFLTDFWVFLHHPGFDAQTRQDRWQVTFRGLSPLYLTGLQAVHDPGAEVVFAGAVLLAIGLAQSFSGTHRRLWARLGGGEWVLAGSSHRRNAEFARVFGVLSQSLGAQATPGTERGG